jgi:hypothetical protein
LMTFRMWDKGVPIRYCQTPMIPRRYEVNTTRRNIISILGRNTNKMQLCNRIYYFKVYWRLNMFRAAHRSSSGALNCICSLWFIHTCGDRPLSRSHPPWTTAGHHMGI